MSLLILFNPQLYLKFVELKPYEEQIHDYHQKDKQRVVLIVRYLAVLQLIHKQQEGYGLTDQVDSVQLRRKYSHGRQLQEVSQFTDGGHSQSHEYHQKAGRQNRGGFPEVGRGSMNPKNTKRDDCKQTAYCYFFKTLLLRIGAGDHSIARGDESSYYHAGTEESQSSGNRVRHLLEEIENIRDHRYVYPLEQPQQNIKNAAMFVMFLGQQSLQLLFLLNHQDADQDEDDCQCHPYRTLEHALSVVEALIGGVELKEAQLMKFSEVVGGLQGMCDLVRDLQVVQRVVRTSQCQIGEDVADNHKDRKHQADCRRVVDDHHSINQSQDQVYSIDQGKRIDEFQKTN